MIAAVVFQFTRESLGVCVGVFVQNLI